MPQTNFTKEQMDALKQFVSDTIERQAMHDALKHLSTKIDRVMGGHGSYVTDRKLEELLNSDIFKQPEPEAPVVESKIDLSKEYDS